MALPRARIGIDGRSAQLRPDKSRVNPSPVGCGGTLCHWRYGHDDQRAPPELRRRGNCSGCNRLNDHSVAVWMAHGDADTVVPLADGKIALAVFSEKNHFRPNGAVGGGQKCLSPGERSLEYIGCP